MYSEISQALSEQIHVVNNNSSQIMVVKKFTRYLYITAKSGSIIMIFLITS